MNNRSAICLTLLLLLPLTLLPTPLSAGTEQVLTREDLQRAGITRLHEIFTLLDFWDGSSINGQDWRIASPGPAGYESGGWMILVDDHPVPVTLPDWSSFSHIPVSLSEIESVTIYDTPGIYQGRFSDRGVLHIRTRNEESGLQLRGRMMAGNEINDPGPYEFTELNSPNEERIGPDMELAGSWRQEGWFLQGSGSHTRHRSTDTPIERRIKQMLFLGDGQFGEPTNRKEALHFQGGYEGENLTVRLQAGGTRHKELPFDRSYGREIPTVFQGRFSGAHIRRELRSGYYASATASWQGVSTDNRPNLESAAYRFASDRYTFRSEIGRETDQRTIRLGGAMERLADRLPDRPAGTLPGGWIHGTWSEKVGATRLTAEAEAARGEGAWSASWAVRSLWRLPSSHDLSIWLAQQMTPAWRQNDLYFWKDRSWNGIEGAPAYAYAVAEPVPGRNTERMTGAGAAWSFTPFTSSRAVLRADLRTYRGVMVSRRDFRMVDSWQWFEHDGTRFYPDEESTQLRLGFSFTFESLPGLRHHIHGALRPVVHASEQIRAALREVPARKLTVRTDWTPVRGFTLWGVAGMTPSIRWREFEQVDGQPYSEQQGLDGGIYRATTQAYTRLDVGGSKSLWQERIVLDLILKNLLNQAYLLHPVGADNELTFQVQLSFRL